MEKPSHEDIKKSPYKEITGSFIYLYVRILARVCKYAVTVFKPGWVNSHAQVK